MSERDVVAARDKAGGQRLLQPFSGVDGDEAGWVVVYNAVAPQTELLKDCACLLFARQLP